MQRQPVSLAPAGTEPSAAARFLQVLALWMTCLVASQAASVTLAWDPNSEPDVAGYRLYYGEKSVGFGTVISAGNATNTTIADLQSGLTYAFYVTCYNTSGLESEPSNVVEYTVPQGSANQAPVALSFSVQVVEGTTNQITVSGSDPDGDPVSFSLLSAPAFGALTSYPPNATYVAPSGYVGTDSFTFTVNDGFLDSEPGTVTIEVLAANRAPTAVGQSVTLDEDQLQPITLQGNDPEGTPLVYSLVSLPQHGALSGTPPSLAYRPASNYVGSDTVSFVVGDGVLTSGVAVVSLTVRPVNDAPVALGQSIVVQGGTNVAVVLAGNDAEGDALIYQVTVPPAHGTLGGTAPNLVYTPAGGYSGADQFTFVSRDASLTSSPVVVAISVLPAPVVNLAPVVNAGRDCLVTLPGKAILRGGVSDDGLPTTASAVTAAWSVVSGPAGVRFGRDTALSTWARFDKAGTYVLRLTATDGELTASDDVTMQVGVLPSAAPLIPHTLYFEAESATLTDPMKLGTNTPAAGGADVVYVSTPTADEGSMAFAVAVPDEGDYIVWCRVNASGAGADSFRIRWDGDPATEDIYDVSEEEYADAWRWTPVNGRGGVTNGYDYAYALSPRVFHLTAGQHLLEVLGREQNTLLDSVVITSDSAFDPEAASAATTPPAMATMRSAGDSLMGWTGIPGRRYQLLWRASLEVAWAPVGEPIQAQSTELAVALPVSEGAQGFYTVVLLP